MRKIKKYINIFWILILLATLSACYSLREKNYYSNKENYIIDTALVENIIYDESKNAIYFWLSEINSCYQDSTFKIEGTVVNELIENNILCSIQIGSEIEYISAPQYFGDGYCMPIVAISIDGEEILSFDEGYNNLMNMY